MIGTTFRLRAIATALIIMTSAADASFNDASSAGNLVRAEVGQDIAYLKNSTNKLDLVRGWNRGRGGYRPSPHVAPKITTWDKIGKRKRKRK